MIFFDEDNIKLQEFDNGMGNIIERNKINVVNKYFVDAEEQGHYDVLKEYPNGGRDVAWVVDAPEQGHWEQEYEDGKDHPEYGYTIPNRTDKEPFDDIIEVAIVHLFTQDEKDQHDAERAEIEKKNKEQADFLQNGSAKLKAFELQQTDLMQAVAELGVLFTEGRK